MTPPRELDLSTWKRRAHFDFFRAYELPFWNVTVDVDVTGLSARAAAPGGPSFFLATLHAALAAANGVEELRQRIRGGDRVVVHERIHGGSTVLRPDETFAFAYFDFDPDYARFAERAGDLLGAVRSSSGALEPRPEREDLIHFSVLPWITFSSFQHARRIERGDSVPKIVFGRHRELGGRRLMPVSVEVHHALVDGLHVGRFFEYFQAGLDQE
jgi:chloramphenicol O-acetyltransferase type A